MKPEYLYRLMTRIGLDAAVKFFLRKRLRIVMFHGIMDDDIPMDCWWLLKRSKFVRQIEFLSQNFHFLSLDEALSRSPLPNNSCVLTFDDGYKSTLTHVYPVLKERGIPFTVYVTTGPVSRNELIWTDAIFLALERKNGYQIKHPVLASHTRDREFRLAFLNHLKRIEYRQKNEVVKEMLKEKGWFPDPGDRANPFEMLTVEDVRFLAADPLVTIGAHTVNHEILTKMPLPEAVREIEDSRDSLEEWIGRKISHFAYPDGKFNQALADKVERLGFKSAVRIGLKINWRNKPFELCRLATGSWVNDYEFQSMVNGLIPFQIAIRHFLKSS